MFRTYGTSEFKNFNDQEIDLAQSRESIIEDYTNTVTETNGLNNVIDYEEEADKLISHPLKDTFAMVEKEVELDDEMPVKLERPSRFKEEEKQMLLEIGFDEEPRLKECPLLNKRRSPTPTRPKINLVSPAGKNATNFSIKKLNIRSKKGANFKEKA